MNHVQAIIVAVAQYAEAALGNREFFLNILLTDIETDSGHLLSVRNRFQPVQIYGLTRSLSG
jgi:hypothetical protein